MRNRASFVIALLLCLSVASMGRAQERPNIIFIMADDVGVDWFSCYGADHPTPNIDRLAQRGVLFRNVWCTPICTPTRIELLTGLYPCHTGWTVHHDVPRWGGVGFDPDRWTCWARLLRQAGYATAIAGKWQVNDFRRQPDVLRRHGFDEHCVWTGYETGNVPPSDERYWNAYLMTNGERRVHEGEYGPSVIHRFVRDFVTRHRDEPFCLYYPMLEPHGPHVPTPLNRDRAEQLSPVDLYAGQIEHVDYLVGDLLKLLDELGIANRTLVIFTADNGSSRPGTINGRRCPRGKGRLTHWGVHVPFVVFAPFLTGGNVGRECDALVDFTDVYPTLLEVAGVEQRPPQKLDGRSFVWAVAGRAPSPGEQREWIYTQLGSRGLARDHRYELRSDGFFVDLLNDPFEEMDLRDSLRPEHVAARARLKSVLDGFATSAPPPFPGFGRGRAASRRR